MSVALADSPDRMLTRAEVAEFLGVRPQTLAKMAMAKRGPPYMKDGKIVRYRREDVERYRNSKMVGFAN